MKSDAGVVVLDADQLHAESRASGAKSAGEHDRSGLRRFFGSPVHTIPTLSRSPPTGSRRLTSGGTWPAGKRYGTSDSRVASSSSSRVGRLSSGSWKSASGHGAPGSTTPSIPGHVATNGARLGAASMQTARAPNRRRRRARRTNWIPVTESLLGAEQEAPPVKGLAAPHGLRPAAARRRLTAAAKPPVEFAKAFREASSLEQQDPEVVGANAMSRGVARLRGRRRLPTGAPCPTVAGRRPDCGARRRGCLAAGWPRRMPPGSRPAARRAAAPTPERSEAED